MKNDAIESKLDVFWRVFLKCMVKHRNEIDNALTCYQTTAIFVEIFSRAFESHNKGTGFGCQISATELSRRSLSLGRKAVERRLQVLARYALITADTEKVTIRNGKPYRETTQFKVNKQFLTLFNTERKREYKKVCEQLIDIGINRDLGEQGFTITVNYGKKELLVNRISEIVNGKILAEKAEEELQRKNEKKLENEKWNEHVEKCLEGCRLIWKKGQARNGLINIEPGWAGNPFHMASGDRTKRNDLKKIILEKGATVTAWAWSIFCMGRPERDATGKIKFKNNKYYEQFASVDKSPVQFSKYFDQIILSEDFRVGLTEGWPEVESMLYAHFGDALYIEARYQHHTSFLPFTIGDKEGLNFVPAK